MLKELKKSDPVLAGIVVREVRRQKQTINLVASENIAPEGVLELLGSSLTNKYSEGYLKKRYYPGTEYYDSIELLAQKRARSAFGLGTSWSVNVQAYSGAIANLAIYLALLKPGDTILSMALSSGGHLSHGAKVSETGKLFKAVHYIVDDHYRIDYKEIERLAKKHKPSLIVSGASAYPFSIDFKKIGAIARKVGAYHVADISHYAGLVASGVHPSPFRYADVVMTTTHKSLLGPRGALIFAKNKQIGALIDRELFPGLQGGPHNNTIAAIAHGLYLVKKRAFSSYARRVVKNASFLANELEMGGCTIVGGGTDSHMILINVASMGMNGKDAEQKLEKVGILANRNTIAGDTSPQKPSALRLGTYWITAQGMGQDDMKTIAGWVCDVLFGIRKQSRVAKEVKKFVRQNYAKNRR